MQATLERLRERREERGDEGGFTLIELLIVIVILGILAAIVVFAVQNLTSQSAKASCGSDYKTVETAMETYKAQVGHYPAIGSSVAPLALGDQWATTPGGTVQTATNGDTTPAPGATDGVQMLYATQTGVDGSTVGAWLKDAPTNGSLYRLWVVPTKDGSGDAILVENLATQKLPTTDGGVVNVSGGTVTFHTASGGYYTLTANAAGVNGTCSGASLG